VLGTRPWFAFVRDNIDQTRALRCYRSWLQTVSG
jgi:hypothetical protein